MSTSIKTLDDVVNFANYLIRDKGISIHPDDNFNDYIDFKTGSNIFSESESEMYNTLMDDCFSICEENNVDIYQLMNDVLLKATELNKFIPIS